MNSTYAQKSSTVQKAADTKAASVLDSSAQSESLQRKADMANGESLKNPVGVLNGILQRQVQITQQNPIPNIYPENPNATMKSDAKRAVAKLSYANLGDRAGLVAGHGTVRIDNQGGMAHGFNIQAQVNNITGHSTIAHANLQSDTNTTKQNRLTLQVNEITRKLRHAMLSSLNSGHSYLVHGNPSN